MDNMLGLNHIYQYRILTEIHYHIHHKYEQVLASVTP